MKKLSSLIFLCLGILLFVSNGFSQDAKTTTFSGKIFRSDTKTAIPEVLIMLLDEKKSDKEDNSAQTKTDQDGKFLFNSVKAGKYTIAIEATFDREEDVPCTLLMGKIDEPNSSLVVETKGDKHIEHVFIKNFSFKAGKELRKGYDLVCKSMFGN